MTAPAQKKARRSIVAAVAAACAAAFIVACGTDYYEIPIETPIQPKMDVSPFQRVLVAGFVAGGTEDVDANQETVRLLRSQLRTKSQLKVIDADLLPLLEVAQDQNAANTVASGPKSQDAQARPVINVTNGANVTDGASAATANGPASSGAAINNSPANGGAHQTATAPQIKDEKDLEPYERLFANTAYWKRIGEEFQNPLIVTGTVLFSPHSRSGYVQRDTERMDSFGRRQVVPQRMYMERKGFILRPKFVFIDGRTGATIYSETYREEILYNAQTNTPALSSYFELMDRLVPNFLSALSSQKIKGTRVLLK